MRQVPANETPKTAPYFLEQKRLGVPLCLVTCYDYPSARVVADTDIDAVLVGDSVAMVVHGHETTVMATLPMMEMHTQAVARGIGNQLLISDLPFLSYRLSIGETVQACQRLMQAGAQAIKLEGADADVIHVIRHLVTCGIPIVGHIGLTPQFVHQLGGYRVQGKEAAQAEQLVQQARALAEAGCFALVIECVPESLAARIQTTLAIPTIGIGAGASCDGQILVWHDLLGIQQQLKPRFVKQYAQAGQCLQDGLAQYCQQVRQRQFPTREYSYA